MRGVSNQVRSVNLVHEFRTAAPSRGAHEPGSETKPGSVSGQTFWEAALPRP